MVSSCFSQSLTAELITASAGFLSPNSKHIQIQNTTFQQNQQVDVLLDVVEKGFGNICLCYDGAQQGCCYYNNSAHLQWQESPLQMVFWQNSILIQNIPIRLDMQIWNSQMLNECWPKEEFRRIVLTQTIWKGISFHFHISLIWVLIIYTFLIHSTERNESRRLLEPTLWVWC